ncbi:MAG: glycosyltransferase [Chitinophagaceae bacterium]
MLITFIHNNKAFLPEVSAYVDYFSARGITCEVIKSADLEKIKPDVAWHFMGTDTGKKNGWLTIHEYTSSSVPPMAALKNALKRINNAKPDYRIFLNEYVRSAFSFSDGIAFGYRDMGVSAEWLTRPVSESSRPDSFIYVGELQHRGIRKLLNAFSEGQMKGFSLLIISKDYENLSRDYRRFSNIRFEGPVPHAEIRTFIADAAFAINFMPDQEPYNRQTSTKLLEYAACGVPVITSDYAWMRAFQEKYGGKYFYLNEDLSNFNWDAVDDFKYAFPDLTDWTWEKQIERSGITNFLRERFTDINWKVS